MKAGDVIGLLIAAVLAYVGYELVTGRWSLSSIESSLGLSAAPVSAPSTASAIAASYTRTKQAVRHAPAGKAVTPRQKRAVK